MNPILPLTTEETPEQAQNDATQKSAPPEVIAHAKQREVKKLLRFTSRRHPIHRLVDAKTGCFISDAFAPAQCWKILRDAPEYQWRERTAAALALRAFALSSAQARSAARVLGDVMNHAETSPERKAERETRETLHNLGLIGLVVLGVTGIGVGLQTGIISDGLHQIFFNFGVAAGITSLLWIPALLTLTGHRRRQLRLACAVTLRKLKLPESARAFAVAAQSSAEHVYVAQSALLEILPLLMPEHYGRLEMGTAPELCRLLRTPALLPGLGLSGLSYPTPLCKVTLEALAKIGDGRAVRPTQKFAEKCPVPHLQAKALEILPILLARQAQEQARSILLRGSSAPAAPENELLRAANSAPETAPETLLRASQKD